MMTDVKWPLPSPEDDAWDEPIEFFPTEFINCKVVDSWDDDLSEIEMEYSVHAWDTGLCIAAILALCAIGWAAIYGGVVGLVQWVYP